MTAFNDRTIISPSTQFMLTTERIPDSQTCKIKITPGNHEVLTTKVASEFTFFKRDENEWVFFKTSHYSVQFVNLNNGESYNNEGPGMSSNFCWASTKINKSGTIIAVEGCYWAAPYEIRFFDISKPEISVIQEIRIKEEDENFLMVCGFDLQEYQWINDTDFEFFYSIIWDSKYNKPYEELTNEERKDYEERFPDSDNENWQLLFRIQLRKENDEMIYILKETDPIFDEMIVKRKIYQGKHDLFKKNFPTNSRYQYVKKIFPNSRIFFFYLNGCFEDVDSDIQEVHFGAWVGKSNQIEIKSYNNMTNVTVENESKDFLTIEDAITYISQLISEENN